MTENTKKCSACGDTARYAYTANFRIGGTSGGWKLLLGEWAEVGEEMIPLAIYVCPNCGKVEMYGNEDMKNRARRSANELQR